MAAAGRKAARVSEAQLEEAIRKAAGLSDEDGFEFNIYEVLEACPAVAKDLAKIEFDFENCSTDGGFSPEGDEPGKLIGLQRLGELSFLGCAAGGDWEFPIFFILYLDSKGKLRGYVPTEGNPHNTKTKSAFGNGFHEEGPKSDAAVARELYGIEADCTGDLDEHCRYDWALLAEAIAQRISVV